MKNIITINSHVFMLSLLTVACVAMDDNKPLSKRELFALKKNGILSAPFYNRKPQNNMDFDEFPLIASEIELQFSDIKNQEAVKLLEEIFRTVKIQPKIQIVTGTQKVNLEDSSEQSIFQQSLSEPHIQNNIITIIGFQKLFQTSEDNERILQQRIENLQQKYSTLNHKNKLLEQKNIDLEQKNIDLEQKNNVLSQENKLLPSLRQENQRQQTELKNKQETISLLEGFQKNLIEKHEKKKGN